MWWPILSLAVAVLLEYLSFFVLFGLIWTFLNVCVVKYT